MAKNRIKILNVFDRKACNITGVGIIKDKEYEFYLDGEEPDICIDIHKHWIKPDKHGDSEKAYDSEKSRQVKTFDEAIEYINRLFNGDIENMKPVGFSSDYTDPLNVTIGDLIEAEKRGING